MTTRTDFVLNSDEDTRKRRPTRARKRSRQQLTPRFPVRRMQHTHPPPTARRRMSMTVASAAAAVQILLLLLLRIDLSLSQFTVNNNDTINNNTTAASNTTTTTTGSNTTTSNDNTTTLSPSSLIIAPPPTTTTAIPTDSRQPSIYPSSSSAPAFSQAPSLPPSQIPTNSVSPSMNPSKSSAPTTKPTQSPTIRPSHNPSVAPSTSSIPSASPSKSPVPTLSRQPSSNPSDQPSDIPTPTPSVTPSSSPTISMVPTASPSSLPSSVPTKSLMPSTEPSVSMVPTESLVPSSTPSGMPTDSPRPTNLASETPSLLPSMVPTTIPTKAPNFPPLQVVPDAYMKMTLLGLEKDISSFLQPFRNATSRHVERYWRSFGVALRPIYINNVRTQNVVERRLPPTTKTGRVNRFLQRTINYTGSYPDPLEVVYSQSALWTLKDNTSDRPELHDFDITDIFTLPFFQDGRSYTQDLRRISNNTRIIILDFHGVVDAPTPAPLADSSDDRQRKILAAVVTIVLMSVLVATAYIVYITRFKEEDGGGGGLRSGNDAPSAVAAPVSVVGVNATDVNLGMNVSFDEDLHPPAYGGGGGDSGPEHTTPPPPHAMAPLRSNSHEVSLSNTGSPPRGPGGVLQGAPVEPDYPSGLTLDDTAGGSSDDAVPYVGDVGGGDMPSYQEQQPQQAFTPMGAMGTFPTISTAPLTASDIGSSDYGSQAQQPSSAPGAVNPLGNYSPMPSFQSSSSLNEMAASPMMVGNDMQYATPPISAGAVAGVRDDNRGGGDAPDGEDEGEDGSDDSEGDPNVPFLSGFQMQIQDLE